MKYTILRFPYLLILALFALPTIDIVAKSTTTIIYVNCGNAAKDKGCLQSLTSVVANLNKGGAGIGRSYNLVSMDFFSQAIDFSANPPQGVSQVALVCHGVYVNGQYTGNLQDLHDDSTPEGEVDPYFPGNAYHCGKDGKIDSDQIGNKIAYYNSHNYTSAPTTPPSTGGTVSSGTWKLIVTDGQYSYMDGNVFVTVGYFNYTWVFVPTLPPGSKNSLS